MNVVEEAFLSGHPGRRRREEDVGGDAGEGERDEASDEALMFRVTDEPVLRKLGFYREQ